MYERRSSTLRELVPMASSENKACESEKMVVLKSSDGEEFHIERRIAEQSETIKSMMEDMCDHNPIPLTNIKALTLAKIICYWNYHATTDESKKEWDKEFVETLEKEQLMFEVMIAANYLDAKPLLDLTCQAVAGIIKDMSVEQVCDYFGIQNDFTPEEEAKFRDEHKWAFE